MGITIEITTSNNITRKCEPPFRTLVTVPLLLPLVPLHNSSLKSLTTFSFQIFYFLLYSKSNIGNNNSIRCTQCANVKLVKTAVHYMRLKSKLLPQITLLGTVQPPFTTLLTVHLLVALVHFSKSRHKSLIIFSFLIFYSVAVFEIQHRH